MIFAQVLLSEYNTTLLIHLTENGKYNKTNRDKSNLDGMTP